MARKPAPKSAASKKEETPPQAAPSGGDPAEEQDTDPAAVASTDNVGDISVEVNVEDLIAQLESESKGGPVPDGLARRKIEDMIEEKRVAKEIMDLDDFDVEG
ncbi:MAG: hypothetical protein FJ197_03815 [Gammaproteobacteria bacterium]|nr:hypothetical protein [Gammaproteobacteria bacterium]